MQVKRVLELERSAQIREEAESFGLHVLRHPVRLCVVHDDRRAVRESRRYIRASRGQRIA